MRLVWVVAEGKDAERRKRQSKSILMFFQMMLLSPPPSPILAAFGELYGVVLFSLVFTLDLSIVLSLDSIPISLPLWYGRFFFEKARHFRRK